MGGPLASLAAFAGIAVAIVLLLWARRWLFLVWTLVRPAIWPAIWGLLLLAVLGLVPQGQAIVQRAFETDALWALLSATLLAAALMGYAAASLLFVRYEPIASSLAIARARLELPDHAYDWWCDRVRRVFPLIVASLPCLAILPGALLRWLPDANDLARMIQLGGLALVVLGGCLAADTRLLRATLPPRRQWLWPLRYPSLDDASLAEALQDAAAAARSPRLHRVGDFLLAGMLPATRWAFGLALTVGCLFFVAALTLPPAWLEAMGTASIVMAAATSLAVTGALLVHYVNRLYSVTLPYLLAVLLLGAGLLARWGVSDNHAVRRLAAGAGAEQMRAAERPTLEEQLATWLAAHDRGDGRPVPLIVAVAQGGGIRAALWTALSLGELQARLPRLPCDLFAITGVSGGSVGAITYAAMLAKAPSACGPEAVSPGTTKTFAEAYVAQAADTFGHDLLAPVAAGLFFPDLLARFVPLPLPDRQTMLEQGWEAAWAEAAPGTAGLDRPFLELFGKAGRGPSLFLVASEVEGGRRWIASNVRIDRNTFADAVDTLAGHALVDTEVLTEGDMIALSASTAAGLSARFPYVSPAGTLRTRPKRTPAQPDPSLRTWHLLDGGVVESSGAVTAGEILLALRSHCRDGDGALGCKVERIDEHSLPKEARVAANGERLRPPRMRLSGCDAEDRGCILVRPAVIQLTNDRWAVADLPPADPTGPMAYLWPEFPETLNPLIALLASRTGRGRGAHDRLQGDPFLLANGTCTALDIVLNPENGPLADPGRAVPLGWTLRPQHVEDMREAIRSALDRQSRPDEERSLDFLRWHQALYELRRCPGPPLAPRITAINAG